MTRAEQMRRAQAVRTLLDTAAKDADALVRDMQEDFDARPQAQQKNERGLELDAWINDLDAWTDGLKNAIMELDELID